MPSTLLTDLSDQLAAAVAHAARSVVAVDARPRLPSSGVHWRDGLVVTTDATVKRPTDIRVMLPDGRTVAATLVGRDPATDLAALRIEPGLLPVADRASAATLAPGHLVLALARTSGDGPQASFGAVSATGGAWRTWRGGTLDRRIQSDVALHPGFGGGPLVTAAGAIAGINSGGLSKPLAVTIPDTTIDRVLDALLAGGQVSRGWLGASLQLVRFGDAAASRLSLAARGGLVVIDTEHDSPAAHAGMLIGDVLIALGGTRVEHHDDVLAVLGRTPVGGTLEAELVRGGARTTLTVTVGERPRRR
jgi:S1-C subfamily serine protease